MAKTERNAPAGNHQWRVFMGAIEAGMDGEYGRKPRGGLQVGANPTSNLTQLPEQWDADASHASHVVYHYGTAVAWIDGRDGVWVIPPVTYSPQTSGVQNRIREYLGSGFRTTVKV